MNVFILVVVDNPDSETLIHLFDFQAECTNLIKQDINRLQFLTFALSFDYLPTLTIVNLLGEA